MSAALVWWKVALLIGVGTGILWWLGGRATRDQRLRQVVLASFAVRLFVAAAFFAGSYWRWPFFFRALQRGDGFWIFGLDSRAYDHFGRIVANSWTNGIELPKPEIGFEYIAFVAGWYRFLGPHPAYPIVVNCWFGVLNGLLAYVIGRKLTGHRAALLGAALVSCWPSSLIWSSQLLKDPLSWSLLFATLALIVHAGPSDRLRRWRRIGSWVLYVAALSTLVILVTRVRFYLGSALSAAAIAVFVPIVAVTVMRRQFQRGLRYGAIALIVLLSTLFARTLDIFTLLSPAHPERGHFRLAVQYRQEGKLGDAAGEFTQAINLNNGYRDAYLGRAAVQVQQGELDKALHGYMSYLEQEDPERRSLVKQLIARIYADQGLRDFEQGKLTEAVAAHERALLFESSSAPIYANLGIVLGEQRQFERANAMLAKALSAAQTSEERERVQIEQERIRAEQEHIRLAAQERIRAEQKHIRLAAQERIMAAMPKDRAQAPTTTELSQPKPSPMPERARAPAQKPRLLELPETSLVALATTAFSLEPDRKSRVLVPQGSRPDHEDSWGGRRAEVLAHSVSQMNEQALATASETTPEMLGAWRRGFVVSGGHSLMDPMAMIASPGQLLLYAPRALAIGVLAPFPWQWVDVRGSTGIMRAMAGIEMLLWYLLLPCMVVGVGRLLKRPWLQPEFVFFLVTILMMAVSLSLVVANLGSLFRLRLHFFLPLLLVAASGDPFMCYQQIGRWVRRLGGALPPTLAPALKPSPTLHDPEAGQPLISVIIPAYNAAATIEAAIQSVLHQTYPHRELIVVDDGSVDGTAERVHAFGDRVRYVHQEHRGPGAARNRGIAEARGTFVALLDADDLWLPQKLERQLAVLQHEPALDVVQCSAYLVNDALEVVAVGRCRPGRATYLDALFFRSLPALASTLLARKRCLEDIGGFSTDREEVWDVACRLLHRHQLHSLPDCLVLYRQHAGNRSHDVESFRDSGIRTLQRVFADPTLPAAIRRREMQIWARFYAMLAGGYFRHGSWNESLRWAWRALVVSPSVIGYLAQLPLRRLDRMLIRRRKLSLANRLSFVGADSMPDDMAVSRPCASSS